MSRVTVFIPDDVLEAAEVHYLSRAGASGASVNRSAMVTLALGVWSKEPARADVSARGRTETLRAARAARVALSDLEATLTQARPVKRRVRRYAAPARRHRDT